MKIKEIEFDHTRFAGTERETQGGPRLGKGAGTMRDSSWRYRVIIVEGSIKWMMCINPQGRHDWALPGQRGVRYVNYRTVENAERAIAAMRAVDKEPKTYRVAIVRV